MDNVENNEATNNEVGNTTIFTFIAPLWGDGGEVINPPTGGGEARSSNCEQSSSDAELARDRGVIGINGNRRIGEMKGLTK